MGMPTLAIILCLCFSFGLDSHSIASDYNTIDDDCAGNAALTTGSDAMPQGGVNERLGTCNLIEFLKKLLQHCSINSRESCYSEL